MADNEQQGPTAPSKGSRERIPPGESRKPERSAGKKRGEKGESGAGASTHPDSAPDEATSSRAHEGK